MLHYAARHTYAVPKGRLRVVVNGGAARQRARSRDDEVLGTRCGARGGVKSDGRSIRYGEDLGICQHIQAICHGIKIVRIHLHSESKDGAVPLPRSQRPALVDVLCSTSVVNAGHLQWQKTLRTLRGRRGFLSCIRVPDAEESKGRHACVGTPKD